MESTPDAGTVEILVDFGDNTNLSLDGSTVGKEIHFELDEVPLTICFPNFDYNSEKGKFQLTYRDTIVELNWQDRGGINNTLGNVREWTTNEPISVREYQLNQVVLKSGTKLDINKAKALVQQAKSWSNYLIEWVETLEFKDTENAEWTIIQDNDYEAYYVSEHGNIRIQPSLNAGVSITKLHGDKLTIESLASAVQKSLLLEHPPRYYQLLNSSLKHMNSNRYRQSLLDSSTAAELALTEILDRALVGMSENQRKLVSNKYNQLSTLRDALNTLGTSLPHSIIENIATPRNNAMHKAHSVSQEEANLALNEAKDLIYVNLPLDITID